jgi:ankyrin repeat protein
MKLSGHAKEEEVMHSILPLIFSLLILESCGKHSQTGQSSQGSRDNVVVTADALSQDILEEKLESLKKYANSGGDLEAELANGRTLLTEACYWSKFKVIEFLVSKKVSLEKKDRSGRSGQDYGNEDLKIDRTLHPELLKELKRSLVLAATKNDLIEVKKILEERPPLNFILEPNEGEGETFLTFCVKSKLENVLRLLAQPKYELDVNMFNAKGESPLKIARDLKFANIEKLLIKLGAKE